MAALKSFVITFGQGSCLTKSASTRRARCTARTTSTGSPPKRSIPTSIPARGPPGNPYRRGRISTVELLALTSLYQLLIKLKRNFSFLTKQPFLMRRSTVLSLSLHLFFPGQIFQFQMNAGTMLSYLYIGPKEH